MALVLPNLMRKGMFTDGLLYSTVANNLAHGKGSLWHLYNSETLYKGFYEQPPLYFWIMAILYKIFGDSIFVERIYDFFMLLATIFLIHKNWKTIFSSDFSKYSFVPVLFWITIPVCFWAYSNNMLEITVSFFVLLASLYLFKYYFEKNKYHYLFISGSFITMAWFTKGFVGLFPLSIPFFYYLFLDKFSLKKWIKDSFLLSFIPLFSIGLVFLFKDSRTGITIYLTHRVFHSISSVSNVDNRFYILWRLVLELSPLIGFNLLLISFLYFKKRNIKLHFDKKFLFLFSIAFSASFPLIITKEQRGFYLVNSFPYYAMALGWLFIPIWKNIIETLSNKTFIKDYGLKIGTTFFIIVLLYSFSQIGHYNRDKGILQDIKKFDPVLAKEKIISTDTSLWNRWNLHSYFMRFMHISLDRNLQHKYLLLEKGAVPKYKSYHKLNIKTSVFDLYKKELSNTYND